MKLSEISSTESKNNLTFLRLAAAIVVFLNHCFPLTGRDEPLADKFGITLGTIAVDVFFVISGFLITKSIVNSRSDKFFIMSRVLRIYPGLIGAVIFSTILGSFFTNLSFFNYITDQQIKIFLLKGSTLLAGVEMQLPGVFIENPYKNAVNGSLWTLIYEVKMYIFLFLTYKTSKILSNKLKLESLFTVFVIVIVLISYIFFAINNLNSIQESHINRFTYLFFSGSLYFLLRKRIFFEKWFFYFSITLIFLLALFYLQIFKISYMLLIPYIVMYLSFVPSKFSGVNENDFSYGIYVYAFPIQQSVVSIFKNIGPYEMMVICAPIIGFLSVISWYFIEKKALNMKEIFRP